MGFGTSNDLLYTSFHSIVERLLIEQVTAGIAGEAQLREEDDIGIPCIGLFNICTDVFRVFLHVAHFYRRDGAGNSDVIQHGYPSNNKIILS